ncbi:MAG: hypothetical protein ACE5DK_03955 [Paracoccaceae bacterium]
MGLSRRKTAFSGLSVSWLCTGLIVLSPVAASAASVCIANQTDETLLLVVDDAQGHRASQSTVGGRSLCLKVGASVSRATVGVFADASAEEGCSRLTRPGQTETLIGFAEFDNCRWVETDRNF